MDYLTGAPGRRARETSAAIQVGARSGAAKSGAGGEDSRWSLALTIFFRVVALLWIVEGLAQWRRILLPASGAFLDQSDATIAATIFFAVLDPIAAVGLWLIAPWGGVVWLLTLFAQIFVAAAKPAFFLLGPWLKFADAVMFAAYLFLSWRVNVLSGDPGALDRLIEQARLLVWSRLRRK